ncbi:phage tail spike protein [uncultured Clostridium sp.]|uniref:phage tail spike protein n=1 Tax=uncultured Clostridium sp. TaxID=59620 RepID=UPI0025CFD81C|nr:phage tail spike protein [uncultured Clostridium sp.]
MIEVYKSTNTNFDFNGDMVLKPYLCDLEVELNGMIEITLEHTYDKEGRWKYIEKDNLLRAPYPFKKERQLFYIYDIDKGMTGIKCKARHIFFDLASEVLVDCRPTNCNGEEALKKILSNTNFIGHSNIVSINTAHYIRKHISNEALISEDENSFINKWGGELDVDNFNVYLNERVGLDNGITFKYSKDLINLNENSNIDDIVTRILPVGFDGITIPEIYVDSQLINTFRKIRTKVIKFEDIKVKEKSDDEDGYNTLEEAQEALREACKNLFDEGLDKLLLQLDLEVATLENTLKYEQFKDIMTVGLGDTVGVEHLDIGINVKTRVVKFIYDCISKKFKSITLANYIENDLDNQNNIDSIIDKITNSDGTVNAIEVAGVLNAVNVQMRAMKDIAQRQDVRALLCEDLDPESPTYGAMCYGTMGFMIASERTPDNRDWDWRTFGTGKGFFADLIVAGTMLADRIKSGMLMSMNEKTWINMDDGTFNFADVLKLIDGKLILTHTNGSEGISIDKGGIKVTTNSANNGMEEVAKIIATSFSKDRNQNGLSICTTGYGDYIQIGYQKEDGTIRAATYFVPVSIPSAAGLPFSDAGIYIYDPIFFKNSLNIKSSGIDHQFMNLSGNYLGIYGDNGLEFGYKSGTALKTRLKIHESPPSGTGDLFESYGNWNFKGYTLHNINIQNSNLTNNYVNLDSRSAASVTALESCEEDTIRYIYKDIRSIGNKIILNIPNKYKGCNYRIIGVAKKGFGDYSITSEEDTRFTIETDRELIMNIEISIDISLLRKEFKTEEAPLSEEVNYEYENS